MSPTAPADPDDGTALPAPTVRDLLAQPDLRLTLWAGESGLDRAVRWANSTELVDPGRYLREHELVLTVGVSLADPQSCQSFVTAVAAAGCSGIGFGTGDIHETIPAGLVESCRAADLPLLEVPHGVPFLAVMEYLSEQRTDALAAQRETARERDYVGRLLDLVRSEMATPDVLVERMAAAGVASRELRVSAWPAVLAGHLSELGPCLVGTAGPVALLVAGPEWPVEEIAAQLGTRSGLSAAATLEQLPRALTEASAAYAVAGRRGGLVRADDLTTVEGLLQQLPPQVLAPFADRLIAPLVDHDAEHGTQLVTTLRAFLDGDGVKATAEKLFLHANSLRNRLTRIHEITDRNPLEFSDRMALAVGLWAWEHRRHWTARGGWSASP